MDRGKHEIGRIERKMTNSRRQLNLSFPAPTTPQAPLHRLSCSVEQQLCCLSQSHALLQRVRDPLHPQRLLSHSFYSPHEFEYQTATSYGHKKVHSYHSEYHLPSSAHAPWLNNTLPCLFHTEHPVLFPPAPVLFPNP